MTNLDEIEETDSIDLDGGLDAFLRAGLEAEPLEGDVFTRRVMARVERSRRHRRRALAGATGLAGALAVLLVFLTPEARSASELPLTPGTLLGALLLLTACGLVWIGTEAREPARGLARD